MQTFVRDAELQKTVTGLIQHDCQELVDYIGASKRFKLEVNSRSKDRVISFGEKLSCRFMTYLLKDRVSPPQPPCPRRAASGPWNGRAY